VQPSKPWKQSLTKVSRESTVSCSGGSHNSPLHSAAERFYSPLQHAGGDLTPAAYCSGEIWLPPTKYGGKIWLHNAAGSQSSIQRTPRIWNQSWKNLWNKTGNFDEKKSEGENLIEGRTGDLLGERSRRWQVTRNKEVTSAVQQELFFPDLLNINCIRPNHLKCFILR
jgi:hypothetical protein